MIDPISMGLDYSAGNVAKRPDDMGKDEFLQLLVTQLRNQDPLEPMDDTDFIAQMSQFSSLEQLVNMNNNMTEAMNMDYVTSQSIANSMATSLLGREVTAESNMIYLGDSGEANLSYQLNGPAHEVKISIYNELGELVDVVYEDHSEGGINSVKWDGKSSDGVELPEGHYSISVEAKDASGERLTVSPLLVGTVERVQYMEGAAYLIVNGTTVTLGDVSEVGVKEG